MVMSVLAETFQNVEFLIFFIFFIFFRFGGRRHEALAFKFDRAGSFGLAQRVQKHLATLTGRDFLIDDLYDYLTHVGSVHIAKIGHQNPALSIPPDHPGWPHGGIHNLKGWWRGTHAASENPSTGRWIHLNFAYQAINSTTHCLLKKNPSKSQPHLAEW